MRKLEGLYKGKRVLVTGGLGFIGSNLVRRLVDMGAFVTVIDSLIPDYGGNLFNVKGYENKIKINISDVRDRFSMNHLVQNQDILFNLAGTLSHVDSMSDPFVDLEINCVSQLSILEACRFNNKDIKVVYAGTRNQYGKAKYLPVDEAHPLNPTDVNGINCIAGEKYHLLYNNVYGIKACSLRLTNTYGPRHLMKHSKQGVLSWFIRKILDGEVIELFGDGTQIRDLNFVDDVVDGFLKAGISDKVWGEVFNLGGEPISLIDFVKKVIKIYGKGKFKVVEFPENRKKIEIGDYIANYAKFKRVVGWEQKIELDLGIKKTIKFYEKNKKYYW
ncbi:MAG: hypothetical protein ACD_31C00005G0072 [uncultured bacterium]|uniref:NAD-dependent epimerase/dehydratase domain-containing protein n=3 Tax=Candidatus Daviesiibacteriota TaxID=1752718 RepID=A0A0G0FA20_9BACT|nr:MAG: hypothetical protein ACD_31C00005G0072 [uncultured bacterium]KKQ10365.1 MAG: hypothetical protein US19_C0006G0007 [Candidatus Daviesbacteria bacterium GW2011_GWB1_36_5]KKQ15516.1 MAG: hypothetical protein US28_C0015G0017 [Candidatus Daviesbacteria bacterium GW2011_GWA1_36_8]OGE17807.1 MAG: NAD-dependent epimerase [Candidatus Daviesbacteria bacterium RIFCSPHIGHO2_01_FULL_36_37]